MRSSMKSLFSRTLSASLMAMLVIGSVALVSCDNEEVEGIITFDEESYANLTQNIAAEATTAEPIYFNTTDQWFSTIEFTDADGDWLTINPHWGSEAGDYKIDFIIEPNTALTEREAIITIICGEDSQVLNIIQAGATSSGGEGGGTDVRRPGDLVPEQDLIRFISTVTTDDNGEKSYYGKRFSYYNSELQGYSYYAASSADYSDCTMMGSEEFKIDPAENSMELVTSVGYDSNWANQTSYTYYPTLTTVDGLPRVEYINDEQQKGTEAFNRYNGDGTIQYNSVYTPTETLLDIIYEWTDGNITRISSTASDIRNLTMEFEYLNKQNVWNGINIFPAMDAAVVGGGFLVFELCNLVGAYTKNLISNINTTYEIDGERVVKEMEFNYTFDDNGRVATFYLSTTPNRIHTIYYGDQEIPEPMWK